MEIQIHNVIDKLIRLAAKKRNGFILLIICILVYNSTTYSQVSLSPSEKLPFKSRWSFRSNAVDWLLLTPNIGLEFDISNSVYNSVTIGINTKYNFRTKHNFKSSILYNLFDIRAEGRYYWRTTDNRIQEKADITSFRDWLNYKGLTRAQNNNRFWRSYFIGGYFDYNTFSFKFGKKGIQGYSYGLGMTTGFGIPLYGKNQHYIDLELGINAGFVYTQYDKFTIDREFDRYSLVTNKAAHFIPYPVINDIRISFVYRFCSIQNKYQKINPRKALRRDSITHIRELKKITKDSIRLADSLISIQKEKQRHIKDSLHSRRRDSLKMKNTVLGNSPSEKASERDKEKKLTGPKKLFRKRKKEKNNTEKSEELIELNTEEKPNQAF